MSASTRRGLKTQKLVYSGFLLGFEPIRTEKIAEILTSFGEASESFSAIDWKFQPREIVLLSLDADTPSIGGAALMQRMHGSGGTGKLKMRLSHPVLIDQPVTANELRGVASLKNILSTSEKPKRIKPSVWLKILERVKKLRPEISKELEQLLKRLNEDRRLVGNSTRIARLIEQRDALGLTLELANADRQAVFDTLDVTRASSANSILDLLDHEPLQEQDVIRHDERIFKQLLTSSMRGAQFRAPNGNGVRVYVYDKKSLETVLGIDLLIYQESYESFILLQYKTMEKRYEKKGSTWLYRADMQLEKQIKAMQAMGKLKGSE